MFLFVKENRTRTRRKVLLGLVGGFSGLLGHHDTSYLLQPKRTQVNLHVLSKTKRQTVNCNWKLECRVSGSLAPFTSLLFRYACVTFAHCSVVTTPLVCHSVWLVKPHAYVCASQNAQRGLDRRRGHLCVCSSCASCSVSHSVSPGPHDREQVVLWRSSPPPAHTLRTRSTCDVLQHPERTHRH